MPFILTKLIYARTNSIKPNPPLGYDLKYTPVYRGSKFMVLNESIWSFCGDYMVFGLNVYGL